MLFPRARRVILGVASLVLAGCSDPLGPSDVLGTYILTRAGAAPLPLAQTLSDGSMLRLVADTVVLRADGTGRRHRVEWFLPVGGVERRSSTPVEFTYRIDGRTIHALVDSGANAIAIRFELVTIGDMLWGEELHYERVGAPAP